MTGCAGFIGAALSHRLLGDGHAIVGVDNVNAYYDPALKEARLARLLPHPAFRMHRQDIVDAAGLDALFSGEPFDAVAHLAAQPGVRHSLTHPRAYVDANVVGFLNVLESCRHHAVPHLVFASTSSVYGLNADLPLSPHASTEHPISLYAATKKANEAMAHSYAPLFRLPSTGVRFFTVYGPWGRPDMAFFSFTKAILEGRPIHVFNHGRGTRDYTYIDDLVEGLARIVTGAPAAPNPAFDSRAPDPASSSAPYRLVNIGNGERVELMRYIEAIEAAVGRRAEKILEGPAPGDVEDTLADVSELRAAYGFVPSTSVEEGIRRFVGWYRDHYGA